MEVITERKSKRTGKKVYRVSVVSQHKYRWFETREGAEKYVMEIMNEREMASMHCTINEVVPPAESPDAPATPALPV
jgi:hypothetical protein